MEATRNAHCIQFLLLSSHGGRSKHGRATARKAPLSLNSEMKEKIEIRVCTNRTCRKQGSLDAFQVFSGIAPPFVTVKSCGCLGRCGSGPNVVIFPEGIVVGHCGTPTKAADTMSFVCGGSVADDRDAVNNCLEALALRKRAEEDTCRGDFAQAINLLSQAIDLKPFGGVHIMYKDRSSARLAMGDANGALEDAKEASSLAPHYPEAYICEGDALMDLHQFDTAEKSYSFALNLDPLIRRSKSFKARITKLHEKLALTNSG
ncbi:uncharacterized protein LOC127241754 [Andrographis paniculata]|uniref:uncharacterized protein LOC127241754 n=1 Tax=Andrographis paniculata TaxID=175694 RepID=UPI0021E933AC|nr:uncharacterized protein LOC127241754 [Andrographis paniculata]XP_051116910.1 uncharacterized protein LOC127241754 [Andrographis paniculata]